MFNMKKDTGILSLRDAHDDSTDIYRNSQCSNHINKKDNIHNNKEKDHDQRLVQTQNRWNEIFQKRQIHYRLS